MQISTIRRPECCGAAGFRQAALRAAAHIEERLAELRRRFKTRCHMAAGKTGTTN